MTSSLINFLKNNKRILQNPKLELCQAKRGYIYSVDFGYNIGSELRDRHYCVVLAVQGKVANVVPFTSKNPQGSAITRVNLGVIPKLSSTKISYALPNQITTVSRSRLMTPRVKGKMINVKLNAQQMDDIEQGLILCCSKRVDFYKKIWYYLGTKELYAHVHKLNGLYD